jgi:hypothetical protein
MGRTWILHTETKGTGATMVPLERAGKPASAPEPVFVPRKPQPRKPEPPGPRVPRRFRIVDVMTRQNLAEDVGTAEAIAALGGVRSIVDVNVYMWQEERERWRLLTLTEQRAMLDVAADQATTATP